jgi:hypothetical protein
MVSVPDEPECHADGCPDDGGPAAMGSPRPRHRTWKLFAERRRAATAMIPTSMSNVTTVVLSHHDYVLPGGGLFRTAAVLASWRRAPTVPNYRHTRRSALTVSKPSRRARTGGMSAVIIGDMPRADLHWSRTPSITRTQPRYRREIFRIRPYPNNRHQHHVNPPAFLQPQPDAGREHVPKVAYLLRGPTAKIVTNPGARPQNTVSAAAARVTFPGCVRSTRSATHLINEHQFNGSAGVKSRVAAPTLSRQHVGPRPISSTASASNPSGVFVAARPPVNSLSLLSSMPRFGLF